MNIKYTKSSNVNAPTILFLHGANSTFRTFTYIREGIPDHNGILVNYNSDIPIFETLELLRQNLKPYSVNWIVSHSLGGIIAIFLSQLKSINKIVTISAPFGGSKLANWIKYIPTHTTLFAEIAANSSLIHKLNNIQIIPPTLSIVTSNKTNTLPSFFEESDGVVTLDSQMSLSGPKYKKYGLNHFETLVDRKVRSDINDFLSSE